MRQYDSLNPKTRGRESAEEHAAPWPAAGPLMEGRPDSEAAHDERR